MTKGIDRLLRPRSIAVVGGGTWCANLIEQCLSIGFDGDIWPVHPTRDTVGGLPAFRDVQHLPVAPDAAFVGINRDLTIEAVRALALKGAGGAVCFAAGFSEAQAETGNGRAKQAALLEAAGDMTILGPNCYGFVNYLDGAALWPDQHGGARVDRGVAIVSQSSNIAINLTMQNRGLPIAYVVTVGNQARTGLSDIARTLLQDDRVTALGLHIEGVGDLRAFEALAVEAQALGKHIVALKVGKSDQAQAQAVSHTASLSGGAAGASALLRRSGIAEVASLPALLETLKLLHVTGPLASNQIVSMSCSGGEASLMADTGHGSGLIFPPLNTAQASGLRAALGPRVALANPLDYNTFIWGDVDAMTTCFTAMMQGDVAMGCVILDFPRADRCDASAWDPVITAIARTMDTTGRAMAVVASLPETMPEEVATRLVGMGIVPFSGMVEAIAAMATTADMRAPYPDPLLLSPTAAEGRLLDEADAKSALSRYGVQIPATVRADSPENAAKQAAKIGFPVALKGSGLSHKSEAGAVILGLQTEQAVKGAAKAMPVDHFLIEEMITDTTTELLIGVVADPAHGYVLTMAAGGTLTELLDDRACLLVPSSRDQVAVALMTLRIAPLLKGYRGKPASDIDAILDAVMAVQSYVAATLPLEIEINPLMCRAKGALAADALIRIGDIS